MPIKETGTIRKFEYESPDGDCFRITYLENQDRKYIEIQRLKEDGSPDGDSAKWDYDMLMDISDTLRSVSRKSVTIQSPASGGLGGVGVGGLSFPQITDHRGNVPASVQASTGIQKAVNQAMDNFDNNAQPVESFDPDAGPSREEWHQNATGINLGAAAPDDTPESILAGDTPEDIAIGGKSPDEMPRWQREAASRMANPIRQADPARRIKKVAAQDLI